MRHCTLNDVFLPFYVRSQHKRKLSASPDHSSPLQVKGSLTRSFWSSAFHQNRQAASTVKQRPPSSSVHRQVPSTVKQRPPSSTVQRFHFDRDIVAPHSEIIQLHMTGQYPDTPRPVFQSLCDVFLNNSEGQFLLFVCFTSCTCLLFYSCVSMCPSSVENIAPVKINWAVFMPRSSAIRCPSSPNRSIRQNWVDGRIHQENARKRIVLTDTWRHTTAASTDDGWRMTNDGRRTTNRGHMETQLYRMPVF